jgi:hypothetical protein
MKMRALLLVSLVCVLLGGCSAYSVHPLYTAEDAVVEPALEGTWVSDDKTEIQLKKTGAHEYSMVMSSPDTKEIQTYKVNLVRLGDQLFADMIFDGRTLDGTKLDEPAGAVDMHVVLKLTLSGGDLGYAALDQDAIEKQNAEAKPPLDYMLMDSSMLVTAPTDVLRRYVVAHAAEVFSKPEQLKRKAAAVR